MDKGSVETVLHLTDVLPQIILILDEAGVVDDHNPGIRELLPAGVSSIRGERLDAYLHPWEPGDAQRFHALLQSARGKSLGPWADYAISFKNSWSGRSIYRAELHRRRDEGGCILILEDVTLLRQMEEEYRRVQRIQSLLPLIKGYANDFKERLQVLYGSVDFIREILKNPSPPDEKSTASMHESLDGILRHLERSNGKLDAILGLSTASRNSGDSFSLESCLRDAVERSLMGSNKQPDLSLAPDLPPFRGNYEKISQMFQNILLNAVQAGTEAFKIEITTELVERKGRDSVLIGIADHGPGMTMDILPRVQQPFFTTKENADGLGLFIAKNIALEYNGSLDIESSPGAGTRVHIYLPLNADAPAAPERPSLPPGLKILVLDDNPEVQEVWERLLYQLGIFGSFAASTSQLYEKFERALESDYPFHLVILEDDGEEIPDVFHTLKRLKRLQPGLPAIYAATSPMNYTPAELKEEGFSAVLRKPFRFPDLHNALLQAVHVAANRG